MFALMLCAVAACGGNNTSEPSSSSPASATTPSSSDNSSESASEDVEVQPETGANLKIWADTTERTFIEAVVPGFTEKYGIQVTIEEVNIPNQAEKLETDGPAKLAADIVMLPHDKLSKLVQANLILPNDLFEEQTRASTLEAAVKASTFDGILYGYPETIETYALFYNRDLVKEVPKTWDDVIAFAETFNDTANKKYTIAWLHNLYFNSMFITPAGGYLFGKEGTDGSDIGLNNEGAIEGLEFYQSLNKIAPIKTNDLTYNVQLELFTTGKLAMTIDGPWSIGAFRDKVNFGIAPLPDYPGGKKTSSLAGVRSFYVNSYTTYPNAAKLLASYLISKESALKDFELANIIPANKEANEDPRIKNDPILSGIVEQFKNSTPMPSIPEMNSMWGPTDAAFASIWNNNEDVKTVMDKAVQSIQDLIKTANNS